MRFLVLPHTVCLSMMLALRAVLFMLAVSGIDARTCVEDTAECNTNETSDDGSDHTSLMQEIVFRNGDILTNTQDEQIYSKTLATTQNGPQPFVAPLTFDIKACAAEGVAMMLFVIIGCGTAMSVANEPGWLLQVSLAFGLAITSLAYAIGTYSGGQINSAVTIGLVVMGHTSVMQGLGNIAFQVLGSIAGALFLTAIYAKKDADKTGGLGTNAVNAEKFSPMSAFLGEFAMTFLLMFVVLQTAVDPATSGNRAEACIAIGFAVFLAHCMLIPIDGCSINPPRTLGPAIVAKMFYPAVKDDKSEFEPFTNMWIFILAPTLGACAASGAYTLLLL